MELEKLKTMSAEDRKAVLESEAIAMEEGKYTKPLTHEEIAFYKDELATNSINQAIILDEFAEIKAEYKDKLEPIKKNISESLHAIKFSAIECDGKLYKMADFDTRMIHKVDELGNVVHSRPMLPEERQFRIAALKQQTA